MEPLDCTNACPKCCDETVEEIQVYTERLVRLRAISLSSVVAIAILIAHICFEWVDKDLAIPEIVWAIILAPYGGFTFSKMVNWLERKKKG